MRPPLIARSLAGFLLVLAFPATGIELRLDRALAMPPPRAAAEASPQALIAEVRVNDERKGEHVLFLRGRDEFLVARAELAGWVAVPAEVHGPVLEGQEYVALSAIPRARWRFDEERLELRITFPPDAFEAQRYAYVGGTRAPLTPSAGPSALLNYRVGAFRAGESAATAWNANGEAKVHWGDWLFTHQQYYTHAEAESGAQRGLTALARDDPARLTRFTLGDAFTAPGDLAGGTVIGGVTYAKAYELDPYLVHQPTASFRTMVETPSQVDVYVGGNRIYRQAVGPGPVEIGNLTYLLGQRDLHLVVRDAFGRERQVDLPFYFGSRSLAPGLQDFSYSAGWLREGLATPHDGYGPAAFSAMHRVGLTDRLTAGFQAEGTRDFVTAGPSLVLRSDRLGELSLAALATRARGLAGTPAAAAVNYTWQSGGFAVALGVRRADGAFRILQPGDAAGPLRVSDSGSVSYSRERWGTVSLFALRTRSHLGEDTRSMGVGYSVPLRRDLTLQASWRRVTGIDDRREAFIGLQYMPTPKITSLASVRNDSGTRVYSVQAGSLLPEGEGAAWRVTAESSQGEGGTTAHVSPEMTYQGRYATVDAHVDSSSSLGERTTSYTASVSGAVAFVGGRAGFSRPIEDSFALVRIEPPLQDIRVYLNRQEIGRTGPAGELFVPRVVSYVENHLAIDDRDVPIDHSLGEKGRVLVPSAGRGDVVAFHAPAVRGISGVLRVRRAGREEPLELTVFVVEAPGGPVEVPVGRGGDFYVENLPTGTYPARLEAAGHACTFAVTIPESHDAFIRLAPIVACTLP